MNASLLFQYKSLVYPDKVYKVKLFANGMVQIPGVKDCYEHSEVPHVLARILKLFQLLTGCQDVRVGSHYPALSNYNAQLYEVIKVDLVKFVKKHATTTAL